MTARRRRARRFALRAHRWISLLLGIWMVAMAATGSVLVVLDEANALLRPHAYAATSGDLGPGAAVDAVLAARPGSALTRLTWPMEWQGVYRVDVASRDGTERRFTVDPGTSKVLGEVTNEVPALGFIRRLHTGLLRDSWFGVTGERVVSSLGLAWLVSLIAGGWTWWWPRVKVPRIRRPARSGAKVWHRRLAAAVVAPLLLIVVTGISFQYAGPTRAVWNAMTLGADTPRDVRAITISTGAEPLGWSEALAGAERLVANGRPASLDVPRSPTEPFVIRLQIGSTTAGLFSGSRVVRVAIDAYTGDVVEVMDPLADGAATQAFEDWRLPLHTGRFGGPATRVIWVVLGPATIATAVTGLQIWRRRRAGRRVAMGGRSEPAT